MEPITHAYLGKIKREVEETEKNKFLGIIQTRAPDLNSIKGDIYDEMVKKPRASLYRISVFFPSDHVHTKNDRQRCCELYIQTYTSWYREFVPAGQLNITEDIIVCLDFTMGSS